MLVLLALRMPIGVAMLLVGAAGFAVLHGPQNALFMLGSYPYGSAAVYELAVIPLFVLMGNAAAVSGMGRDLFAAAYAWVGHWRGGLSSATIVSCLRPTKPIGEALQRSKRSSSDPCERALRPWRRSSAKSGSRKIRSSRPCIPAL